MAEEMRFAEMFKRMVDRNIEPDPRRAKRALDTILRRMAASPAASPGHDPPCPKPPPTHPQQLEQDLNRRRKENEP